MSKWPKWVKSDYGKLYDVLKDVYDRVSEGKGRSRHSIEGVPIERQGTIVRRNMFGPGVTLGQAAKKIEESQRHSVLDETQTRNELLDAMGYLALEIIAMDLEGVINLPNLDDLDWKDVYGKDHVDQPEQTPAQEGKADEGQVNQDTNSQSDHHTQEFDHPVLMEPYTPRRVEGC